MFDEWAKNIQAAVPGGTATPQQMFYSDKYAGAPQASIVAPQMVLQANIDDTQRREAASAANAVKNLEEQRKADAEDPNKAKMILGEDGRYKFFDGTGQPMNINQFSLLTGKRPDEILADSENPLDQKFTQDYKTMRLVSNAWINGDKDTLVKLRASDPVKFNELMSKYKSPSEMVKAFRDYYSDYYGNTSGAQETAQPFSPSAVVDPSALPKPTQAALSNTDLTQVTTPITIQPPAFSSGVKGILERTPLFNRLTGQRDERRRYQEQLAANPWMGYLNPSLSNNGYYKTK